MRYHFERKLTSLTTFVLTDRSVDIHDNFVCLCVLSCPRTSLLGTINQSRLEQTDSPNRKETFTMLLFAWQLAPNKQRLNL